MDYYEKSLWILMCVIIIVANGLVFLIVILEKTISSIRVHNLIGSMVFGDMLVGAVVLPLMIANEDHYSEYSFDQCCAIIHSHVFLCSLSTIHLCLFCFDRYKYITTYYAYEMWMTSKKVFFLIMSAWLVTSLMTLILTFYESIHHMNGSKLKGQDTYHCFEQHTKKSIYMYCIVCIFPCFLIAVFLYFKIIVHTDSAHVHLMMVRNMPLYERNFNMKVFLQAKKKSVRITGLLIAAFTLCWFPFIMQWLFSTNNTPELVFRVCFVLTFVKSIINPFIFVSIQSAYKKALVRLVKLQYCKKSPSSDRKYTGYYTTSTDNEPSITEMREEDEDIKKVISNSTQSAISHHSSYHRSKQPSYSDVNSEKTFRYSIANFFRSDST